MEHLWRDSLQGNTAVLGEKSVPLPLYTPQISHGLPSTRSRASAVKRRQTIAWAIRSTRLQHSVAVRCATQTWNEAQQDSTHEQSIQNSQSECVTSQKTSIFSKHLCKNLKYSKCVTYCHDGTDLVPWAKYSNVMWSSWRARASVCVCVCMLFSL
jgi:hypothetical protein